MKAVKDYLVLVCAVFVLVPAVCISESKEGSLVSTVDVALRGIDEITPDVSFYWTGEKPSDELAEKIEEQTARKLKEAGIEVSSSEPNEAMQEVLERRMTKTHGKVRWRSVDAPELMIRVYVIKHQTSGTCVFNVQTSLARKVYTAHRPRRIMKAEVWRIDVGPSATSAENFETMLTEAVLSQVDTFIAAYQKANSGIKTSRDDSKQKQDTVTPTTGKQETKESATETTENSYVASKNSRVFHKADCYAAKRIMPKNLVKYSSRDEAVQDGKRPCKICKP